MKSPAEQRMARWDAGMRELYGLTPWTRGRECAYRLAGKQHNHRPFFRVEDSCPPGDALWDHFRMWHDADGQLVLTTEPYQTAQSVAAGIEVCERLGLTCEVGSVSPYCPGNTTLFIFRRAAETIARPSTP
jgi:hypothetical protein